METSDVPHTHLNLMPSFSSRAPKRSILRGGGRDISQNVFLSLTLKEMMRPHLFQHGTASSSSSCLPESQTTSSKSGMRSLVMVSKKLGSHP